MSWFFKTILLFILQSDAVHMRNLVQAVASFYFQESVSEKLDCQVKFDFQVGFVEIKWLLHVSIK